MSIVSSRPSEAAASAPTARSGQRPAAVAPHPSCVFSIVMPVYNRAEMVQRAIRSVLQQTFAHFELVIVDDASTDGTEKAVRAFDDRRIVYVRRTENGGNARARNDALRLARGRYITFLDSDDEFMPGFLEEIHGLLAAARPEVGFAWVGRYTVVDGADGESVTGQATWEPGAPEEPYAHFLDTLRGGIGYGLTIRRECLERIGDFDTELASAVDTDYVLRLVQHYAYTYSTTPLVRVHLHEGARVTPNLTNKARSYERIVAKHLPNLEAYPKVRAGLLYKVGWLYYASGDKARGRAYLRRALQQHPLLFKAWGALLLYELFGTAATAVHARVSDVLKRLR